MSVVRPRLASVPPRSSVLPPGAGNEELKKALKPDHEGAKKTEERTVRQTGVVQGHLDTPTIGANRDRDVTAIPAIEQTQDSLPDEPGQPGRFAQSTRRLVIMQPPRLHIVPMASCRSRRGRSPRALTNSWSKSRDRRSPDGLFPTNVTLALRAISPPALPRLENDGGAGQRGKHQNDPEGLSLQHASHLISPSAGRRQG